MLLSISPARARLRVEDHAGVVDVVERLWSGAGAGGGRRVAGAVRRAARAARVSGRQSVRGEEGLLPRSATWPDSLAALF